MVAYAELRKILTKFRISDHKLKIKIGLLTKFCISDHKLEIEIGRYKKVPREQRICKACKVLEDEKHFFLHCHINYNIRNSQIQEIENYYPVAKQETLTGCANYNK
jgi:hypothetical protein